MTNIPNFNMQCFVSYEKRGKILETRSASFFKYLPSANRDTRHINVFAECCRFGTRQSVGLPSAPTLALGKTCICRVFIVCRAYYSTHSAKQVFAECPCLCTRQTNLHSAYTWFPVVSFGCRSHVQTSALNKVFLVEVLLVHGLSSEVLLF